MPDSSSLIGRTISHYRIVEKLGAGGMGEVYRARDERLKRDVALKILQLGSNTSSDAQKDLLREAQSASALNDPHICTIYEVSEDRGDHFIVMELVEGKPLNSVIPAGGLRPELVLRYGAQIAAALAHAHDHGVIHRDIKTANVVITPAGQVKVLDFGLARFYSDRNSRMPPAQTNQPPMPTQLSARFRISRRKFSAVSKPARAAISGRWESRCSKCA